MTALSLSFQAEMRPFVDDIRAKAKQVKEEIGLAKAQVDHHEQTLQSDERRHASRFRGELSRWFARSEQEVHNLRQDELARATGQVSWYPNYFNI